MDSNLFTKIVASQSIQSVRFWTYLFSNLFSLICTLFALYFLLADRRLRCALNNHIIIVLLIIGLIFESTSIPWMLYNDYNHVPLIRSKTFYQFWTFLDYPLAALQTELFAWATIERHILIFHDQWVSTSKKRFFVHYLPIGAIIIYYLIYFSIIYFAPICENSFDAFLSGGVYIPCVFDHTVLGTWDLICNQVVPSLIIVFFSIALLVRTIWQKTRLHQKVNWRKYRKMIIQLLSISTIYIIFNTPWALVFLAYQYGLIENINLPILVYGGYFVYYVIFLFPFVCCLSLPELRKKFPTKFLHCRQTRRVAQKAFPPARTPTVATIELPKKNI